MKKINFYLILGLLMLGYAIGFVWYTLYIRELRPPFKSIELTWAFYITYMVIANVSIIIGIIVGIKRRKKKKK